MKLNDNQVHHQPDMDHLPAYEEILTEAELEELEKEFRPRLGNACYLDHAGATLYAKSQMDGVHAQLATTLFSNPHSRNPSSSITSDAIDYVRARILQHFGTTSDEYSVIFTSGATSAVKLLGESFSFNGGTFAYFEESHTSIVGMREIVGQCKYNRTNRAHVGDHSLDSEGIHWNKEKTQRPNAGGTDKGGMEEGGEENCELGKDRESWNNPCGGGQARATKVYCVAKKSLEKLMALECKNCNKKPGKEDTGAGTLISPSEKKRQNGLLAYPAQCNFSGYKYPLEWIKKIQHGHVECLNELSEFYASPEKIGGANSSVSSESEGNQETSESRKPRNKQHTNKSSREKALDDHVENRSETPQQIPPPSALSKESKSCEEITLGQTKGSVWATTRVKELSSIKNEYDAEIKLKTRRGAWNTERFPTSFPSPPHSRITIQENQRERREEGSGESHPGTHHPGWEAGKPNGKGNTTQKHYSGVLEREERRSGVEDGGEGKNDEDELQWFVLLDAASFVSTNALDLGKYPADFVAISFYKMFGFPTGLGALIVRRNASHLLEKDYFGGGTVNIAIPSTNFHAKRSQLHERFEDGTISFLSILALRHGFQALNKLGRGMDTISERCFRLGRYFYRNLVRMKYANGKNVATLYADTKYETKETQGPVVTFNLLRPDGSIIGYSEMEQMAYLQDVHLRYGCFCNVGACRRHLKLQPDELLKHYEAGHVCGDMMDLMDGKPTGAIRVSFGYMTSQKDVDVLLGLIHTSWVRPFLSEIMVSNEAGRSSIPKFPEEQAIKTTYAGHDEDKAREVMVGKTKEKKRKLSRIFVYPVKSCAGFEVSKMWAIGNRGLFYDREWLILNSSGVPLTQKREPRLCQLKPNIDISNRRLVLSMEGFPDVHVPLDIRQMRETLNLAGQSFTKADLCTSKVCGDTVTGLDCGPLVNNWLSTVLDRSGVKLIRLSEEHHRKPRGSLDEISLANSSQFNMISMTSTKFLASKLIERRVDWPGVDYDEEEVTDSTFSEDGGTLVEATKDHSYNNNLKNVVGDTGNGRQVRKTTKLNSPRMSKIIDDLVFRFRPNFVIDEEDEDTEDEGIGQIEVYKDDHEMDLSLIPYLEEEWDKVSIGNVVFKSGGPCMRCATICTDQRTGERGPEPFLTLSATRRGRPNFGIHLYRIKEEGEEKCKGLEGGEAGRRAGKTLVINRVGNCDSNDSRSGFKFNQVRGERLEETQSQNYEEEKRSFQAPSSLEHEENNIPKRVERSEGGGEIKSDGSKSEKSFGSSYPSNGGNTSGNIRLGENKENGVFFGIKESGNSLIESRKIQGGRESTYWDSSKYLDSKRIFASVRIGDYVWGEAPALVSVSFASPALDTISYPHPGVANSASGNVNQGTIGATLGNLKIIENID